MNRDVFDTGPRFREAVLADARREAEQALHAAGSDADKRVEAARTRAEEIVRQARRQGMDAAARETRRERVEARRRARELVLRERRGALERLRERALQRLRESSDSDAYRRLMGRLEQQARHQLDGGDIEIESDANAGGFVARSDARHVDYRLPVLVERVMEDMGSALEELWK